MTSIYIYTYIHTYERVAIILINARGTSANKRHENSPSERIFETLHFVYIVIVFRKFYFFSFLMHIHLYFTLHIIFFSVQITAIPEADLLTGCLKYKNNNNIQGQIFLSQDFENKICAIKYAFIGVYLLYNIYFFNNSILS